MSSSSHIDLQRHWMPIELRKLSSEDREAILAAQAERAEPLYRTDPHLTDFEAFGEQDLYGESSSAETR